MDAMQMLPIAACCFMILSMIALMVYGAILDGREE
jgi:hypothetical protein